MKKFILVSLCALSVIGCRKTDNLYTSPLSIQNTSWHVSGDSTKSYSFTSSVMVEESIGNPAYPKAEYYTPKHDTILIGRLMTAYKVVVTPDSLLLRDVRTNTILCLYRW